MSIQELSRKQKYALLKATKINKNRLPPFFFEFRGRPMGYSLEFRGKGIKIGSLAMRKPIFGFKVESLKAKVVGIADDSCL